MPRSGAFGWATVACAVSACAPCQQVGHDRRRCQRRSRSNDSICRCWPWWTATGNRSDIDTGFTAFLTLPAALIETLALPWLCSQPGILADGSIDLFDVYVAVVLWDGQVRTVEVEGAESEPLVGMSLLDRHRW